MFFKVGVAPIISWLNRKAEAYATDEDRKNYVAWWTAVANHLKYKDYLLSFNLFTELMTGRCKKTSSPECPDSLHLQLDKYNQWTSEVVTAIRNTSGNNGKRILILSSPKMTADGLKFINKSIYENDNYMMAEFHLYAAGPSKYKKSPKYWVGNGTKHGRDQVRKTFEGVKNFTKTSNLTTYFGEWMPIDNIKARLNESEVIHFATYFVKQIKKEGIPWSLNDLNKYYDTKKGEWLNGTQILKAKIGTNKQKIDMAKVLQTIIEFM